MPTVRAEAYAWCLCYTDLMQQDAQNSGKESGETHGPVHPSAPVSVTSKPFKLPLENSEKMHKGLILGIVVGAGILVLLAVGMWGIAMALSKPEHENTPLVTEQKTSSVPAGWKKFASKKFGVSFIAPEKWAVSEDDSRATTNQETGFDGGYWINVKTPGDDGETYSVGFTKATLDAVVKATTKAKERTGMTTTKKAVTWETRSAVEVTSENSETKNQSLAVKWLFAQIGNYVATLPHADVVSPDMIKGTLSKSDYKKFVDSIKIDTKAVEAQANAKIELPTGKDVQLGNVAVPTGWQKKQSEKYGVSFAIPSTWVTNEKYTGLQDDTVLALTVGTSAKFEDEMAIMVTKTSLDEYTSKAASLYASFGDSVTTKTEKMKWQGYDARRVTIHVGGKQDTSTLIVRIGGYTYNLPDPSGNQSGVTKGEFDSETYKMFVETIRVTSTS